MDVNKLDVVEGALGRGAKIRRVPRAQRSERAEPGRTFDPAHRSVEPA